MARLSFLIMIYIHIPFCRSFCTYCDFYSEIAAGGVCGGAGAGVVEAFVDALCAEIGARRAEIPWEHDTLYIGGGTPSALPLPSLRRIVRTLGKKSWEEFTVEVNPDDVVGGGIDYARGLVEIGVSRVSMGVQSLDDRTLRWMNRRHNAARARLAYRILRDGGIDNISVDLIFGINPNLGGDTPAPFPGREATADSPAERNDAEEWCPADLKRTLDGILNIGGDGEPPRHISAYQLSVEPGSALAEMVAEGRYTPASDEICAREYELIRSTLERAGYEHYEISNFALPGFRSRHNSAYWNHIPYIGFGPAAHSLLTENGRFIRRWNRPDLKAYLKAAETGDWNSVTESETLTPEQIREERIMLSLRTSAGLDPAELPQAKVAAMLKNGSLAPVEDKAGQSTEARQSRPCHRVRIPEDKFFISDSIISSLI